MERVINIYKPQGITPFQLIQQFRKLYPDYETVKIGFAGRLDPLAHGVMILLISDENKNRDKYLNLKKSYTFSVLLGAETDSFDYLGILQSNFKNPPPISNKKILTFIKKNTGKFTQSYPPFSSKTVNGVPMFKLAKKGILNPSEIPAKEIEVYKFKYLSSEKISSDDLKKDILTSLKKITGFFRQTKIKKQWFSFFKQNPNFQFIILKFEIDVSSGTYVRSLAHQLGQELGCGAIAFEILRTKVGKFNLKQSLNLG